MHAGLWPATVDELLGAVAEGQRSRLLGEVHTALLRLLQADMEEAHATGAVQVPPADVPFRADACHHVTRLLQYSPVCGRQTRRSPCLQTDAACTFEQLTEA